MRKIHTKDGIIGCPACGGRMSVTLGWPRWFRRYGPPIVLRTIEECPTGCPKAVNINTLGDAKRVAADYANEVWAAALATYWYKSVKLRAI